MLTVPLGQGSAPFNPRSQLLPVSPSASVSVPNGTFKSGKTSRTCILSLQVSVPYRVNKGVTKKGRKKKKAGEFLADAAADENGMVFDRPSYGVYHTAHLLNYRETRTSGSKELPTNVLLIGLQGVQNLSHQ